MAAEKANALLAKYKPGIRPGKKSASELQAWLEARYDVEPMPLREFSEAFRRGCLYGSAAHAITNWKLQLPQGAFEFVAYRVLDTEKNRQIGLCVSKKWLRHVFRGLHFALAPLARAALRAEKALRRKAFRSRRTCRRSRLKPTGAVAGRRPAG